MKRFSRAVVVIILIISLVFSLAPLAGAKSNKKSSGKPSSVKIGKKINPGRLIVKFKPSISSKVRSNIFKKAGVLKTLKTINLKGKQINVISLKKNKSPKSAIRQLRSLKKYVEYAVEDKLSEPLYTPNDPYLSYQWSPYNHEQNINGTTGTDDADIDGTEAWDIENTNPVTVAVIDSGVDTTHEDLDGRFWQNSDEVATDNDDDDNNGFKDDRIGYNFAGISQYANNQGIELGKDSNLRAQHIRGRGRDLSHIGIFLRKTGNPNFNVRVRLRSTISGSDLASFTIDKDDVDNDWEEYYRQLNNTVNLNNDSVYYLVFTTSSTNNNNFYYLAWNATGVANYKNDPFVDGYAWSRTDGDWDQFQDNDYYFKTNPMSNVKDDCGHGTHVAGIIGAEVNNNKGLAGISRYAKVMVLKSGASNGSLYDSDVVSAIDYAVDNGAKVISMSFGGTDFNQAVSDAVQNAYDSGVTLVAAAGNDGDGTVNYPAGYTNVIGVGATDNNDTKAGFSNTNWTVDISAPGVDIWSTMPTYAVYYNNPGKDYTATYDFMNGTSMATPVVSAVAAMVKSKNSNYTPEQVYRTLRHTAQDLGTAGRDNSFGYGRLNAYQALLGDSISPNITAIISTTHPSSNNYYKNDDPSFYWGSTDNTAVRGYSYWLNKYTIAFPDSIIDGSVNGKAYQNLSNGTWYLHLKAVDWFDNWSSVSHFKINIDKTIPTTKALTSVAGTTSSTVTLGYKVSDTYSDDKANVSIVIKNSVNKTTVKVLNLGLVAVNAISYYKWKISGLSPGLYSYNISATDQAGNVSALNISNNLTVVAGR